MKDRGAVARMQFLIVFLNLHFDDMQSTLVALPVFCVGLLTLFMSSSAPFFIHRETVSSISPEPNYISR